MNRTLRALALVGLLGNVIYLVGFASYHAGTLPLPVGGASSALGALFLWAYVLLFAAWLGTTCTFVAGVVAAVAAVQRRQRPWSVALIGVLALHALSSLLPFLVPYVPLLDMPVPTSPLIAATLLALLVLVYRTSRLSAPDFSPGGESRAGRSRHSVIPCLCALAMNQRLVGFGPVPQWHTFPTECLRRSAGQTASG